MKIIRFLLNGFIVALIILLFFEKGMLDGYESYEKFRQGMIFCVCLSPVIGTVLWALKEAGLPLLSEFINGDIKVKVLITTIVLVLIQMKL